MDDREQQRRERAYKIWEDEGRPTGAHEDHWKRAHDPHELTEQESEDVIKVNQEADREFSGEEDEPGFVDDIKPPSVASPD
ncbi:DUF2934 domain-containing protein [Aureimonas fodinaquatilis]|uniref:DUF2934 domain-containing protein n=1 Tax=Aureimonas fodinaquatilis TaxID=2565783 RepID=A0A5B0DTK4_9HYPH|nr:DUF2934 domain-containing protein [Aureimonas fodinaquatilis]KAA0968890.1 DUF2934 domain-containing protein [Aureimonas fodinaquatilis]